MFCIYSVLGMQKPSKRSNAGRSDGNCTIDTISFEIDTEMNETAQKPCVGGVKSDIAETAKKLAVSYYKNFEWEELIMKKKLLSVSLLALAAALLLSGCSLFATPSESGNSGNTDSSGAVKMTDNYTFEDPTDLDFDTRYVLHCDENTQMISQIPAEYGVLASYSVTYAKEDAPVADYEFFVCDSAEHAQATADFYASLGQNLETAESDPCVLYSAADSDTFEASLVAYQSYGMLEEATVSAYVTFMQTTTGGTILE